MTRGGTWSLLLVLLTAACGTTTAGHDAAASRATPAEQAGRTGPADGRATRVEPAAPAPRRAQPHPPVARAPVAADRAHGGAPLRRVRYIQDLVTTTDDDVLSLLGGSAWVHASYAMILVASDVVIVLDDDGLGGARYADGDRTIVRHVSGAYLAESGWFGYVAESLGDGAILRVSDGSLWAIPEYDRFDTGWWLPPYPVIVTSNEMYIWNLEKGKRVWATRVER